MVVFILVLLVSLLLAVDVLAAEENGSSLGKDDQNGIVVSAVEEKPGQERIDEANSEDGLKRPATDGRDILFGKAGDSLSGTGDTLSGTTGDTGIKVILNGNLLDFDNPPYMENQRLFISLRPVVEAMGGKMLWHSSTKTAVGTLPGATIAVSAGSQKARFNGMDYSLPANARIHKGRLFVPLEILETAGAKSNWSSGDLTLSLTWEKPGDDFPRQILDLQLDIQGEMGRMDRELAAAAEELSKTGITGEGAQGVLKKLAALSPQIVDAVTVDSTGKIVAVEPASYQYVVGADIGGREYIKRLWEAKAPVISSIFSVEGFPAIDLERPVFNDKRELVGSVSLLLKPEDFFSSFDVPEIGGQKPEIMVTQQDGYILYDTDTSQIGRNVLTDPFYKDFPDLLPLAGRTAGTRWGMGAYSAPDQQVKMSVWTTVGLHGTEWRVVMNYSIEHTTGDKDEPANGAGGTVPVLSVTPKTALMGDPLKVKVSGLVPWTPVFLVAEQLDNQGVKWESRALFLADQEGVVDPSLQAPVSGTYKGVDPAGLFWSLAPLPGGKPGGMFLKNLEPQKITVSVEVAGDRIISQEIERVHLLPGVQRLEVREPGIVGTLFLPPGEGKKPAIIVLGGSEGGAYEPAAAIYASHGYVTLALAYFGMEGLPDSLINIPVETIDRAVDWLEKHPRVDKNAIGIWGASKGAEFALLASSHNPRIKAVVAKSPSAVVFEGISWDYESEYIPQSSWSLKGEPLPFVPIPSTPELDESFNAALAKGEPWPTALLYEEAMKNDEAMEKAAIPVERINGPVLLISGGLDGAWPSGKMAGMIMDRLKANKHPFADQSLHYEQAGHSITTPYSSTTVNWLALPGFVELLGGSSEGNAAASMDSWPKILEFLDTHLKGQSK